MEEKNERPVVMTITHVVHEFNINEARRASEEAKALLRESMKKVAETDIPVSMVRTSNRSVSSITPAEVKRYAYRQAMLTKAQQKLPMFDMRTSWGKEMSRRVKTYLSFHKKEIEAAVALHVARAKRNRDVKFLESKWTTNVLSNPIYLDYKKALEENRFRHLRVRRDMLSVDCRNHHAATPMDYKVLAILKKRRIDNVEEKWY